MRATQVIGVIIFICIMGISITTDMSWRDWSYWAFIAPAALLSGVLISYNPNKRKGE
ncbi:hypothetical protein LCGC14_1205030 [marine sediment metagenome]|uniref:Major facilitator superfamily (MFS) profile domain-containing protein n=1 Tax=marine sediment metagenome TaxID=412755 RepID=A0A0F9LK87_9ZZZZ